MQDRPQKPAPVSLSFSLSLILSLRCPHTQRQKISNRAFTLLQARAPTERVLHRKSRGHHYCRIRIKRRLCNCSSEKVAAEISRTPKKSKCGKGEKRFARRIPTLTSFEDRGLCRQRNRGGCCRKSPASDME